MGIPVFDDDTTLKSILKHYQSVKKNYKKVNEKSKKLKSKKKEIEYLLAQHLKLRNTKQAIIGKTLIKKRKVSGRIFWKPKRAFKQGLIEKDTYERLREVSDRSSGYTRIYLKNIKRGE